MDAKRLALYALVGMSLLALLAQPVAAAYDSTAEALIRELNRELLYVAIPITVLVEMILFYAVLKFKDNDDPKPTEENRRLEITWTVATAIILVFVGVASYGVMAQLLTVPGQPVPSANASTAENPVAAAEDPAAADNPAAAPEPVEVTVIGQKWFWTFEYPEQNVSTSGTVVIPVDRTIHFTVTARDWIHAVHVPGLGLKQDAIPGTTHSLVFTATETGEYDLFCAEYCGSGHSQMLGTVRVVSQQEYQQWLAEQGASGTNATDENSSRIAPGVNSHTELVGLAA